MELEIWRYLTSEEEEKLARVGEEGDERSLVSRWAWMDVEKQRFYAKKRLFCSDASATRVCS